MCLPPALGKNPLQGGGEGGRGKVGGGQRHFFASLFFSTLLFMPLSSLSLSVSLLSLSASPWEWGGRGVGKRDDEWKKSCAV